ncbi:hypothetical protein [Heyndrickxia camelliae]|uniref:Uncharacterized protein n=1 Tax=Heyndrickxia camelliae TaxID=1707093 RepID=A0A2N3LEM4_9BACI|nr:hypothetical protein [Heyndrickxia camelliae]PKR83070.1 hypothetical protein CWO92_21270 [Heyndrickxia camelliae]
MSDKKEKKRITLTGNKMPEETYSKLDQLAKERKLTPYIVNLVEKENMMDKLIEGLSILVSKIDTIEHKVDQVQEQLSLSKIEIEHRPLINDNEPEKIAQGKIEVSEKIVGGIEEDIPDFDF